MIKSDSADLSLKMLFDMNLDRVRFETEYGTFMELALPNKEIQRVYNTEIQSMIMLWQGLKSRFIDRDIRDIAKYGIAFYGKKVEIAM